MPNVLLRALSRLDPGTRDSAGSLSPWPLLLMILAARAALPPLAQLGTEATLSAAGNPSPWQSAAAWWSVYGTIVDIG